MNACVCFSIVLSHSSVKDRYSPKPLMYRIISPTNKHMPETTPVCIKTSQHFSLNLISHTCLIQLGVVIQLVAENQFLCVQKQQFLGLKVISKSAVSHLIIWCNVHKAPKSPRPQPDLSPGAIDQCSTLPFLVPMTVALKGRGDINPAAMVRHHTLIICSSIAIIIVWFQTFYCP